MQHTKFAVDLPVARTHGASTAYLCPRHNLAVRTQAKREGSMPRFWDVTSFAMNSIIFFYVGASSTNFLIRSVQAGQANPVLFMPVLLRQL